MVAFAKPGDSHTRVYRAMGALDQFLIEWSETYGLTTIELLGILSAIESKIHANVQSKMIDTTTPPTGT